MSFIYNLADTWNAIGTTFNSILMNVSDGSGGAPVGAATSRIINLQSNGTSIFNIGITGAMVIGSTSQFTIGTWAANSAIPIIGNTALDQSVAGNYSLAQTSAGRTNINAAAGQVILFNINNVGKAAVTANGSFQVGVAAIATTATDGFLYIPTCAGTPTGVPTAITGLVPMVFDTTNSQFWFYTGGAWKQPKTPAGAALVTWQ